MNRDKTMSKLIAEIERRVSIIKSEPDGQVRESMIDLLADSLTDFVELESAFSEDMKWIKLTDQLPEAGQKVDLWLVPEDEEKSHRISWTWEKEDTDKINISGCKATHWLPIPSAPNEENTEG